MQRGRGHCKCCSNKTPGLVCIRMEALVTAEAMCRFESVVEQLKSREADELWVSLGSCDIQDSKMESFTEALSQNATVTAVDLSRNSITSAGAQVIAQHPAC